MSNYEADILLWSEHQAELLRRLAAGVQVNEAPDWPNIAEEIESLGRSDRRELRNRIATLLFHLIKLQASPATEPRAGWQDTVFEQRDGVRDLLRDSPSLRSEVAEVIAEKLLPARVRATNSLAERGEQPRVDPSTIEFTEEQVLGPWLP